MHKRDLRGFAGVLIVVMGFVIGSALAGAAQTATPVAGDGLTFDVVFQDTLLVDDETVGFQVGDRVILSDRLMVEGEEVGHNSGVCTITDAAEGEMFCAATWSLPDGTISTQLLNTAPPEKVFAVTGGTGAYRNASGVGTLVEHGDETGTVTFDLSE